MLRNTVRVTGGLAVATALAALAAGGGTAAPTAAGRNPCANKPSKGKPHASSVAAAALNGGKPTEVDLHKVPAVTPVRPARGKPHEVPQPSNQRAKRLKQAKPTCVPRSAPSASAPAKP